MLYIVIVAGIVIYAISYILRWMPRSENMNLKAFAWFPVYLLFSGLLSYYGPFGGGQGIFDVYTGFAYVAVSSVIIYIWAQRSAISVEQGQIELKAIIES